MSRKGGAPPLTVVLEVASLHRGGLETVVRDLAVSFDRSLVRPVIACIEDAGPIAQEIEAAGVHVHVLGRRRSALAWLLERERADLLNAHYSLFGAPVAAAMGIPQVHVLHNSYLWLDDGGARRFAWAFRHVDRFVAVSSSVADYSRRRFGLGDVEVIPNGVDLGRLELSTLPSLRAEARGELGLEDAHVLLCPARYEPRKGHRALLTAFGQAAASLPRSVLVFAGDAPDPGYLAGCRQLAAALGIAERVRFLPFRPDVERLFAAADAFVLPSIVEGASLAAVQAAATGLPLLLTDVGSASDLLRAGAAGILLPGYLEDLADASPAQLAAVEARPPDALVRALADGLVSLARAPEDWRERALASRERLRAHSGLGEMARAYERTFREACGSE